MEWLASIHINGIDLMLLHILIYVDHRRVEWKRKCKELLK